MSLRRHPSAVHSADIGILHWGSSAKAISIPILALIFSRSSKISPDLLRPYSTILKVSILRRQPYNLHSKATNHKKGTIMAHKFMEWCIIELISNINNKIYNPNRSTTSISEHLDRRIRYIIEFLTTCQHFAYFCISEKSHDKSHDNFLEHWHQLEELDEQGMYYASSLTVEQELKIGRVLGGLTVVEMRGHEQATRDLSIAEVEKYMAAMAELGYPCQRQRR